MALNYNFNHLNEMDSLEYLHRVAQQVLITTDEQGLSYSGTGSGFILEYNNNLYFITAAHLLYSQDNPNELLSDYLQIVADFKNHNLQGKFFHLQNILLVGETDVELLKLLTSDTNQTFNTKDYIDCDDIAISIINALQHKEVLNFRTSELKINNEIKCAKGSIKIPIEQELIRTNELKHGEKCCVHGITFNKPQEIFLNATLRHYYPLIFDRKDSFGDYLLSYSSINEDDWSGLSGSPVFDENYYLIGVLLRVNQKDNNVIVAPISKVTKKLDYILTKKYLNRCETLL